MKKLTTVHNLGKIKIRQYYDSNFVFGNPESIYFTATISGWRGFKFISKTLKEQQLFEQSYNKCKEILEDLEKNGNNCLNKYSKLICL